MSKAPEQQTRTDGYIRPSERMFRRSRAARARRFRSERSESRFIRAVFSIAGVTTLIVFAIIYMLNAQVAGAQEVQSDTPNPQPTPVQGSALTTPILGDYTPLDLMGFAFVIIAGYAVYRRYSTKNK